LGDFGSNYANKPSNPEIISKLLATTLKFAPDITTNTGVINPRSFFLFRRNQKAMIRYWSNTKDILGFGKEYLQQIYNW